MADASSWFVAEPCADAFLSLRSYLIEATKLRPEGEDLSSASNTGQSIALKCGQVKYREYKTAWIIQHTSKCNERWSIDSLGRTGENIENHTPSKPRKVSTKRRIGQLICTSPQESTVGNSPLFPPLPLVQLIYRALELLSILKHTRDEYFVNSCMKIQPALNRRLIDIEPIFNALWEKHANGKSRKRVVHKLFGIAIEAISDVVQQMVEPWGGQWSICIDLPRRSSKLKPYLRSSLKSIKSFIRECLADSMLIGKSTRKILDSPERERIRIDTTDRPPDALTSFDTDAASNMKSRSNNGAEEHLKEKKGLLRLKSVSHSTFDSGTAKPSIRNREISARSHESVQVVHSSESSLLASNGHDKTGLSPQIDSDTQDISSCTSPVTGTAVVESTDVEFGKKTELSAIGRQLGNDFETRLDIKKFHEKKELSSQSLFESENRKYKHCNRGETLNLIVDEDSCTSRNKDEISSQSTEKSTSTMEVQVETKHEDLRIDSTVAGYCSEPIGLDAVADKAPQVSGLLASRQLRSASAHSADIDLGTENLDDKDSSWMKLAHMGHISDYHGYQRQHQSFVPLKYSGSVSETRASIEEKLKELRTVFSTANEDADSDQEDYSAAVFSHSKFQEYERKQRSKSTLKIPITMKETPFGGEFENRPFRFTSATSADLTPKKRKQDSLRHISWIPTPNFRSIETDPLTFWRDTQNRAKRPRRTAELNELKKISVMMLSEMYHTLRFIEDYNEGISTKFDVDTVADPGMCESHLGDKESSAAKPLESTKTFRKIFDSDVQSLAKSVDELPLKTMFMNNYEDIQKQFISLRQLPEDSKFEVLRLSIETAIGEKTIRLFSDEEIVKEEKSRTRIARGYKRKADQEKIEKKHHEDERLLLLREFEYANRNKKPSAAEIEMERFESRPIQMVDHSSNEGKRERCQLDTSCSLCKPAALSKLSAPSDDGEVTIIHNPKTRRVDLYAIKDEDSHRGSLLEGDSGDASLRSLMEMKHILAFIEKYKTGMIR
ncbi:unnamed protein product [Cylindrotheca closterium]|uniref:Uncharacterized protein n=1 Tax=Cylindrotheca closterium TaxID=2856 RepID=A0AAD2PUS4_9STRA|nr:unnamed protein product [Cylindrotheca closterium]